MERLSELIGAIYDCALDPAKWEMTLERINREFSFESSVLGVVAPRAAVQVVNVAAGVDAEWLAVGMNYTADSIALWGGEERMGRFPLDEPIIASQDPEFAGRRRVNRYFVDILEPRGLMDGVAITLAREPSLMGYVAFNRHRSIGAIGDAEISALRLLGPHFRRAVTISNLFDLKTVEAATFASTLDAFIFAVVLVDERLAIVHANAAAQGMLAACDPIRSTRAF